MKTENFLQLDYKLLQSSLSTNEALVVTFIKRFNINNKTFYASNQYISNMLGMGVRTVSRAITKLNDYNWFDVSEGKGRNRSININSIELDKFLLNDKKDVNTPEVNETPAEELKTSNNQSKEDTMNMLSNEQLDKEADVESTNEKKDVDKLVNTLFPDVDITYKYDVVEIVSKVLKIKDKYERDEMIGTITNTYDCDDQTDSIEEIKEIIK